MACAKDHLHSHNYIATCLLFCEPLLKGPSINPAIIKVFLLSHSIFHWSSVPYLKEDWSK